MKKIKIEFIDNLLLGKKGVRGDQGDRGADAPNINSADGTRAIKEFISDSLRDNPMLYEGLVKGATQNEQRVFRDRLSDELTGIPLFIDTFQQNLFEKIPYIKTDDAYKDYEDVFLGSSMKFGNVTYCQGGLNDTECEFNEVNNLNSKGMTYIGSNIKVYNNLDIVKGLNLGVNKGIQILQPLDTTKGNMSLIRQGKTSISTSPLPNSIDEEADIVITDRETLVFNEGRQLSDGVYMHNINMDNVTCKGVKIGGWYIVTSTNDEDFGTLYIKRDGFDRSQIISLKSNVKDIASNDYSGAWYTQQFKK